MLYAQLQSLALLLLTRFRRCHEHLPEQKRVLKLMPNWESRLIQKAVP